MNWLLWIFGQRRKSNQRPNLGIPIPEGTEPDIWKRAAPPKRNRRKYSQEEIEEDRRRWIEEVAYKSTAISRFNRERATAIGCKSFIWRSCKDADVCEECAKNNGRRFSYINPPSGGFPGERQCPREWCRCYAEPIIPR